MTNIVNEIVHNFPQQIYEGYGSVLRDYIAKRDKQNEWLTLYNDAEKLIEPFSHNLRGKKVYCNCDDPESSGTFQFLLDKFHAYGLKQLVATGFYAKKKAVVTEQNILKGPAFYLVDNPGNGDMNSDDSMQEAKNADVIISNPPFSKQDDSADMNLFCNWIKIAFESDCDLIGIGMTSSIKYVVGFNIKQKILNNELFVYPAHKYSFKRVGDKTRNLKGKEKNTVQISIYSTFKIDIEKFSPKPIKFNKNVYLNDLPLTKINNNIVHVTYNSNKFASFQQDVANNAFSVKMIPPPTPDNVGQVIVVPFSAIDYDYREYFDLIDILNVVYVYDSTNKIIARKMTGLCLKYNKTDNIEQLQFEFKPENHVIATELTSDNIIQRVSAFKKWARDQYLAGNIDLLLDFVHKKLKYMTQAQHGAKSDYTLKIEYAKQCKQFIYNLLDINTPQPATDDSMFRKSTEIYKTGKSITDKNKKLFNLSRQLTVAKSKKNSDNAQLNATYPNLTIAGIERAQAQLNIIKACVDFCEKFDNLLKKMKKLSDIDVKNEGMRIKKFAQDNIIQYIDALDNEIAAEIRYKILRLDDILTKAVSNMPYMTYNNHVNELAAILKSDVQYDKLDSVNRRLHDFTNLRSAIIMYKRYLENNKDQLDDELRNSILNKENELFSRLKQEISDFKKRTKHIRLGKGTYISEAFSGSASSFYHKKLTESDYIDYVAHMLDEAFTPIDESINMNFSQIDFSRSIPWTSSENAIAKRMFAWTNEVFPYGFILPDGTKLDFSKGYDKGECDHYSISHAFSYKRLTDLKNRAGFDEQYETNELYEEIKYEAAASGLIRLYKSDTAYMIHIMKKPTSAQIDCLYDMADGDAADEFTQLELLIGTDNLITYDSPKQFKLKLVNDVKKAFADGMNEALISKF